MSIVQRFRLGALRKRAGRLYLRGKPFTGIVYEVQGDLVVANYQVTDGAGGGPAEAWDPTRLRVLFHALTTVDHDDTNEVFPKEGVYFDGVLFDGIAYRFDEKTGRLLTEQDYRPKAPAPMREWYPSGALEADLDRVRPDGTSVSERYYENGDIRGFQSKYLGWGRTPEGRLRSLILRPGYARYAKDDFRRAPSRVDPMLYLAGRGVTDVILARLEDLPSLEHLTLDDTKISARGLDCFRVCAKLKYLGTYGKNRFKDSDVRKLLAHSPGCEWDRRP